MAPRPAKRQRRSTIVLSDGSDEDLDLPSPKPARAGLQREITLDGRTSTTVSPVKSTTTRSASRKAAVKPSPTSSPEKARKNTKVKYEVEKNKSLHNFFHKATEDQRWKRKSETPDVEVQDNGELSDAIEDDDLSDETLQELGFTRGRADDNANRHIPGAVSATATSKRNAHGGSLPSTQRFVKPAAADRPVNNLGDPSQIDNHNHRPWADRYGPTNLEELMVHKKKVSDVQNWLQGKLDGRNNQQLLVLKGPAGSGKTTTVGLLAKALGLQLVSWHNPAVSEGGAGNSISAQFDEFLNRGGQFSSLAFDQDFSEGDAIKGDSNRRLLVIEEFPSTMTRSSNALQSFRSVILRFLAQASRSASMAFRGQQNLKDIYPSVVIIVSETLLSSSTALTDSLTAHRLLGAEILNHPFVTTMDFNPVAPTFVTKALDLVIKKEARDSRRRRIPGPAIITRLAEMGDVRSAVNSLEFLCVRGGDGLEWSGTVAAKAKRPSKNKENLALTEVEKNSLQLVCQRETTLDMFHAAGKIVYNKREDPRVLDTRAQPPPKPPDHLMHLYTPKASEVDIEALLNETGTDIQTFISTLHENYILSCNGDTFEERFEGCSDILSASDVLNPEIRQMKRRHNNSNPNFGTVQSNVQAGTSDTLRQDEISFHVATRGLLFNLPHPVTRAAVTVPGAKRGDSFKMFYPASLRLWKPIEETEGLLETFVYGGGMLAEGADVSSVFTSTSGMGDGGVANWRTKEFALDSASRESSTQVKEEPTDTATPNVLSEGPEGAENNPPPPVVYSKDTLATELLPYMTRILAARRRDTTVLEKITKFKPTSYISTDEDGFEEDDMTANAISGEGLGLTQPPTPATRSANGRLSNDPPRQGFGSTQGLTNLKNDMPVVADMGVGKLYISDDDIEDD
ncbi:uncharacterized protein Z520_10860 [Fonsecaea multimorphosa CBS 102226]|uniref:Checkpoint protein RAD24-like helical bundle domain-containing protein n=1 Tax=Fonsecaea multimorphosa CBS 102226 TaxID=1442371 RepID=A0A0D2I8D9_9EURO|nr:uncharacterized protein Z520_10860 [Fonsecaea multimorphosa CBS 102226]KIX93441.1 hypothetical protein Z520_10860 [Fonsecaea multimorphosa CBS 102226]OAL18738.1 hypothetical protein AYO22_10431 [Fonsecaea multimorphosa]